MDTLSENKYLFMVAHYNTQIPVYLLTNYPPLAWSHSTLTTFCILVSYTAIKSRGKRSTTTTVILGKTRLPDRFSDTLGIIEQLITLFILATHYEEPIAKVKKLNLCLKACYHQYTIHSYTENVVNSFSFRFDISSELSNTSHASVSLVIGQ